MSTTALALTVHARPPSPGLVSGDRDGAPVGRQALRARPMDGAVGEHGRQTGPAMRAIASMLERIAASDVGVMLRGESGVGKEVIARELHRRSRRHAMPFVKVNCAALPSDLLESELFGHERGAFTGAWATRIGRFEYAQHGTILLDEIGELPPDLQAKLLHVLQDGAFTRLGSNRVIEVDVRVLAATNRDLEAMIVARTFREDLYYRLQAMELRVPPLRERVDEIPALTVLFLAKYAAAYHCPPFTPSAELMRALAAHTWPGNIRELENVMQRCVVLQDEALILDDLRRLRVPRGPAVCMPAVAPSQAAPAPEPEPEPDPFRLESLHTLSRRAALDAERVAIADALARFRWNRRKASEYLNVSYKTLLNKIKECGITPSPHR